MASPKHPLYFKDMAEIDQAVESRVQPDDDNDGALGSDISTYTQTLRSSLLESVKEHGRSYHKYHDGSYILPEDEQERNRLDLQHEMCMRTFNQKLCLAPIPDQVDGHVRKHPHFSWKIPADHSCSQVDFGTGTGQWAVLFADEHPKASVLGTDLSPMQPTIVPPNCKFEVDDFEAPWTFTQKFALIHGRMLNCCFIDGKRLFQHAYDALEPGGWFEMQDASMPPRSDDGTMAGTTWEEWTLKFMEAMRKVGRDPTAPESYAQWARDAGFVNVTRHDFIWPQNPWPKDPALKELGRWHLVNTLDGLHGFTVRPFVGILGMSPEEVELLLVQVRKDLVNRQIHTYWPM